MKKFRTTITELILCNLFIISWYYSFQLTIEKSVILIHLFSLILIYAIFSPTYEELNMSGIQVEKYEALELKRLFQTSLCFHLTVL